MQQVREIMSKDLKIASPEDTIEKAAQLMAATNCGALPVGENGRLLGIVTDRDITLRAVSKGNAPNHCTVREVMSSPIKYVFEDEATHAAAHNMSKLQVRRLLVLNRQKRLVGIVSLSDLALKHDGPAAASTLKQVSKPNPVFGVKPWDPLVFATIPGALGLVVFLSVMLPAIRASRISPADALRHE